MKSILLLSSYISIQNEMEMKFINFLAMIIMLQIEVVGEPNEIIKNISYIAKEDNVEDKINLLGKKIIFK